MGMEALASNLPTYSDKDLVICHRQNSKGVWKPEVWTSRAFGAYELQLGPLSSQIKETNLTNFGHDILGIPKHGPGSHPDNMPLALDGRSRMNIAKLGSIDGMEHTGCIF